MSAGPVDRDDFGPVERVALSRIQQIGARRLHAAWTTIPHVTHHEDADVTAIDRIRRDLPGSPTLLACVAQACVRALLAQPKFCASLDPDGATLSLKRYVNLGIAVETPRGLVVAVAHGLAGCSLDDLGVRLRDLAERGRAGTLKPTEMEGSCFTLSSLGALGGTGFTPIINPPNVAILGLAQARRRPEFIGDAIEPRLMLPMSLSYDHRVIDGADAARFCSLLRMLLADPAALAARDPKT